VDALEVLCGAWLKVPPCLTLYLDNGACYSGDLLALVCKRLGIRLVHATPHNAAARGKMERFWRTMRQRCTDHLSPDATLHDVNQALWAWLDADYQRRPHSALLGDSPRQRFLDRLPPDRVALRAAELARALEVTVHRRVKADGTFAVDGEPYEVTGRHLARKRIDLVVDALTGRPIRANWKGVEVRFGPCDPVANRHRRRPAAPEPERTDVAFDPIADLLARAREVGDE
jgi:hypothetical protein